MYKMLEEIMIRDKKGKMYFERQFIKKLNYRHFPEVELVVENVDPKKLVDCHGKTLLHHAAEANNELLVEYLIGRGFQVDAQDMNMDTPLALAIRRDDERTMKVLLAAKADLFICNKRGNSLLHMGLGGHTMMYPGKAAMLVEKMQQRYGDDVKKMAEILLDIDDPFPRSMLLKNTALTRYMLKKGCKIRDTDWHRNTALHYAVDCMDFENVKLLLQLGSNIHARNWNLDTPIHLYKFGKEENHEILQCLLEHGASLDYTNDDGFTVINQAFVNEKAEHVKVLLDHGVDLGELDAECTPLHYLARNENPGVMDLLKGRTFKLNVLDRGGETALFTAAKYANYNAVEFLLKCGANPNFLSKEGETVLYGSLSWRSMPGIRSRHTLSNYVKCVELLLQYGADVQFVGRRKKKTLFDDARDLLYIRPAIAQMAMMKVLDQPVKENVLAKIQSHIEFVKYFNVCVWKMEKIKSTVICNKVSLSTFLAEPEEKLLIYARNQESRARLERFLRRERRSPLYFVKLLRNRIKTIVELVKLREQAALSISKLSDCYNQQVIDRIVLFLDKQAMQNLCQI